MDSIQTSGSIQTILIFYIKMDLALNNIQRLIWHKTNQTKPNQTRKIDNLTKLNKK